MTQSRDHTPTRGRGVTGNGEREVVERLPGLRHFLAGQTLDTTLQNALKDLADYAGAVRLVAMC